MFGAVELVAGCLVDWRLDRARGRIRPPSRMKRQRFGVQLLVGHDHESFFLFRSLIPGFTLSG
jgi:hypothetical protein